MSQTVGDSLHQRLYEKLKNVEKAWCKEEKLRQTRRKYIGYTIRDPYQRQLLKHRPPVRRILQSSYLQPVILYVAAAFILVFTFYADGENDPFSQLILPMIATGGTLYFLLHCSRIKRAYFRVDEEGIRTGEDQVAWKDVDAMFLLRRHQGLWASNYLVLFLPGMVEMRYRYFQEYIPRNFTHRLAAAIRTYRPER